MKTYALYGFAQALANALLVLLLFALGFHSSVEKLSSAQWVGSLGSLAVATTATVLGVRARRSELPPEAPYGYGSALGGGVLIALVAGILGIGVTYVYFTYVNPGMNDLVIQAQVAKMEARGLSGDRLEQVERSLRMVTHPAVQAFFSCLATLFFGTLVSLIAAAFLKRPEPPVGTL